MTKDNVTGKNKDFYDLGKKIFDRLNPQGAINLEMPKARTGDCLLTKVCAAEGHAIQKQREWVGLTEKETIDLALNAFALPEVSLKQRLRLHQELVIAMNEPDSRLMIFAATIEQSLKEKNGG